MKTWQGLSKYIVDTHCHINHYDDPQSILDSIKEHQLTVNNMTVSLEEYRDLQPQYAALDHVNLALGFFPTMVMAQYKQIDDYVVAMEQTRYIGEIG